MQKVNRSQHKWRNAVFFLIGLLIVSADQLSKAWVKANLIPGQSVSENGFFRIVHVHNSGAAFGLFQDYSLILTIVACIAVVAIMLGTLISHRYFEVIDNMLGKSALGLILGGTLGNLVDRFRQGYITDFIDFNFWPTFNIADSAVTVGVIILVFSLLHRSRVEKY